MGKCTAGGLRLVGRKKKLRRISTQEMKLCKKSLTQAHLTRICLLSLSCIYVHPSKINWSSIFKFPKEIKYAKKRG